MAEYKSYNSDTDRTVQANRSNAILYCLRNLKSNMFTIRYAGGYFYFYICNYQTGGERSVVEVCPYSSGSGAFIGVWYTNSALSTCNLTKTL